VLGIFRPAEGGRIVPIDKGADKEWRVGARPDLGAKDGELVEAEQAGPQAAGPAAGAHRHAAGRSLGPRAVSLIAIHQHGIPDISPTP
jgi:ribonuclease R